MTLSTSRPSPRRAVHRLVTLVPPALFGLALAFGVAGCPAGAELEDPQRFAVGTGGAGPSTGGTGPTAGSSGSGSGGMFTFQCDNGADYVATLNANCARTGCHNERSAIGGLDLTPNAGLHGRLKNVVATHSEIDCGNGVFMECIPASCPPPGDALLVDSMNPDDSWLLKKINGTHNDCGFAMPIAPGDVGFDEPRKACLDQLVRAIAAF